MDGDIVVLGRVAQLIEGQPRATDEDLIKAFREGMAVGRASELQACWDLAGNMEHESRFLGNHDWDMGYQAAQDQITDAIALRMLG